MGNSSEQASGIAVTLFLGLLAFLATRRSPLWWRAERLHGLFPVPELPPPRNLSSATS
jgi:hypothetical protein